MEKAAFPVSSLVLQPNLHSHPNQERRGFEFHCAINEPMESGRDNEAGAASKDAVIGSEFQLAPMGGSLVLDFLLNENEFDKTNREINKQQTIRPIPHIFYHISFLYQNVETESNSSFPAPKKHDIQNPFPLKSFLILLLVFQIIRCRSKFHPDMSA